MKSKVQSGQVLFLARKAQMLFLFLVLIITDTASF